MSDATPQFAAAVRDRNRRAWDALVRKKQCFTTPAPDEDLRGPLGTADALGWLGGSVAGKRLLCLASGGGRQSALYASAGAEVTVVDLSPEMLALDRQVAAERGLNIRVIEASMDDLNALADASFEIVLQPVSTCYLPDVLAVYREVARVTAPGGLYLSQHKQPGSLQAGVGPSVNGYEVTEPYYRRGPLPPVVGSRHREEGTVEFLHRWEDLLGGLCRCGFVIEDLVEPLLAKPDAAVGSFAHRCGYLPPYVRIKARRVGTANGEPRIWLPG
ncbi:MAG: SAM-dependent methyltransferase [Planctomycetia bacterium 21-64-5]|nr:MAG: SAM-dependent methyltransferase [Planctomycetia bacterium 21-64-5]HQU42661.1 class I SAM-dependent methyltransferase [Pirellulales bacterium]